MSISTLIPTSIPTHIPTLHPGRNAACTAVLLGCAWTLCAAEAPPDSSTIIVTAPQPSVPDRDPPPTEADPGTWLRHLPGFSAVRMGGTGLSGLALGEGALGDPGEVTPAGTASVIRRESLNALTRPGV